MVVWQMGNRQKQVKITWHNAILCPVLRLKTDWSQENPYACHLTSWKRDFYIIYNARQRRRRLNAVGHNSAHSTQSFMHMRHKGTSALNGEYQKRKGYTIWVLIIWLPRSHDLHMHILQIVRRYIGNMAHYAGFDCRMRENTSAIYRGCETIFQRRWNWIRRN